MAKLTTAKKQSEPKKEFGLPEERKVSDAGQKPRPER